MEQDSPSKLPRSTSLPFRSPHPAIAVENAPSSSSISRPYRLAPVIDSHGFLPPTIKPSALLQRREKANQGLSPVDTASTEANDPRSPTSAQQEGERCHSVPADCACSSKPSSAYDILGILPSASQQEIKSSFQRLARQHHPDKAPVEQRESSSRRFLEIRSAYNSLRDPQSRARYDLELSLEFSSGAGRGLSADPRRPHFCSPSPRIFTTVSAQQAAATYAYTPRTHTPRPPNMAASSFTPRTPYSGRNWETDQCW